MKLRRLHIERYRAIRSLELSFINPLGRVRPVTVLAGPNGSGKTSILFAIVQALRRAMGYRTDEVPLPDLQDIHQIGGQPQLLRQPARAEVTLDLEFDESEQQAIPAILNKPLTLQKGIVQITWQYPPPPNFRGQAHPEGTLKSYTPNQALLWLSGRSVAIREWRARRLPERSLLDQVGALYLFPQDRNLNRRVSGDVDDDMEEEHLIQKRGRRDTDTVWDTLRYLSSYVHQQEKALSEPENWELRIQRQLKQLCPNVEYIGYLYRGPDDSVGAPFFRNLPGGEPYPLHKAASGLLVILEYLVRLTFPQPLNHSLILIDEPEVHLHPSWARRLYLGLPHIGEANQFILTTHSAELRAMAAEDGALIDLGELDEPIEPSPKGSTHRFGDPSEDDLDEED